MSVTSRTVPDVLLVRSLPLLNASWHVGVITVIINLQLESGHIGEFVNYVGVARIFAFKSRSLCL